LLMCLCVCNLFAATTNRLSDKADAPLGPISLDERFSTLREVFTCGHRVQVNKTITSLDLDLNKIGPNGAASLAESLKVPKHQQSQHMNTSAVQH